MIRSNEYPTGYSLRFPRVMNMRTDKPWYSSCTTPEFLSLIKVCECRERYVDEQ